MTLGISSVIPFKISQPTSLGIPSKICARNFSAIPAAIFLYSLRKLLRYLLCKLGSFSENRFAYYDSNFIGNFFENFSRKSLWKLLWLSICKFHQQFLLKFLLLFTAFLSWIPVENLIKLFQEFLLQLLCQLLWLLGNIVFKISKAIGLGLPSVILPIYSLRIPSEISLSMPAVTCLEIYSATALKHFLAISLGIVPVTILKFLSIALPDF